MARQIELPIGELVEGGFFAADENLAGTPVRNDFIVGRRITIGSRSNFKASEGEDSGNGDESFVDSAGGDCCCDASKWTNL